MGIKEITQKVVEFRDKRKWKKYNNPKDEALSLTLEAAELLELFQWKSPEEVDQYVKTSKNKVAEELVDVFYWVLLMSYDLNINLEKAFKSKMRQNVKKYSVRELKGEYKKYTEL